jgi:Xaa-Pro aminopeptidase
MTRNLGWIVAGFLLAVPAISQDVKNPLPDLRTQASIEQEWLKMRLERILPMLMRENNVEMWIIPMREYNEDPVFSSLVSPTAFSARRRTIFVFFDRGPEKGVERLAVGGGSQGGLYQTYRDTTLEGNAELFGAEQWKLLTKIVRERNPNTIAIDISHTHAFADGLTAGEWEQLRDALGDEYVRRIVHAERLALDYISIRLPEMMPSYEAMMKLVHAMIGKAFSKAVITPGVTTTQDVVWWFREEMRRLGVGTWFQPSVDIQRAGGEPGRDQVIRQGDLLHCDVGITAMRLNTDTQHLAYVLKDGETDAPEGLKNALKKTNELQDIVVGEMKIGLTGNEVLRRALEEMDRRGIKGTVYSHPVGQNGHGAGALIGLWDRQMGVPGRGDVPLRG